MVGRLFELENGTIQVSTDRGPDGEPLRGTAPAWRPDGTLTYFADGAVRAWPNGDVILSQRDLVRAMRTSPVAGLRGRFERFSMREAAWLDDRRLAAILSGDDEAGEEDMLAFERGLVRQVLDEKPVQRREPQDPRVDEEHARHGGIVSGPLDRWLAGPLGAGPGSRADSGQLTADRP